MSETQKEIAERYRLLTNKSRFKKGDKVMINFDYCKSEQYEIHNLYVESNIEYATFTNMNFCRTEFLVKLK